MPTEDDALNRICEEVEAENGPTGLIASERDFAKAVARRYAATVGAGVPEEVKRLSEAATQGEWYVASGTDFRSLGVVGKSLGMTSPAGDGNGLNDRAFIVAAANYVRALLASPDHPVKSGDGDGTQARP